MNNVQHTPGPWLIANNGKAGNTYHIWRNDSAGTGEGNEGYAHIAKHVHGLANAHLIAAAPAMYEALSMAQATIERLQRHAPGSAIGTLDVIKAAIAQAEGDNK